MVRRTTRADLRRRRPDEMFWRPRARLGDTAWPIALKELTAAEEAGIVALVKKAVSRGLSSRLQVLR